MAAIENSIMAKKVKCSNLDLSAYPHLEELSTFINQSAAQLLAETCMLHVEPTNSESSIAEGCKAVLSSYEKSTFYAYPVHGMEDSVLLRLSSSFLCAFAERMLGGDFIIGQEDKEATKLEKELGKAFPEGLLEKINPFLAGNNPSTNQFPLKSPSLVVDKKQLKNFCADSFSFNLSICICLDEEKSAETASIHFPIALLEGMGFLEQDKIYVDKSHGNAKWNKEMEKNLYETEIDLDVVIDKYIANLSDLSRLEVGALVPLSENCQNELELCLDTIDGVISLGKARLGIFKKNKAVKLSGELAPKKSANL